MTIKLTNDRKAAVNYAVHWIPVDKYEPPRGTKLLLINERHGAGTHGEWTPGSEWTHWQGWPKFQRHQPEGCTGNCQQGRRPCDCTPDLPIQYAGPEPEEEGVDWVFVSIFIGAVAAMVGLVILGA